MWVKVTVHENSFKKKTIQTKIDIKGEKKKANKKNSKKDSLKIENK